MSPPLVPLERKFEELMSEVEPLIMEPGTSTFDASIMSPLPIERLSSPVDGHDISPVRDMITSPSKKFTLSRENTITFSNLKLETPLTPLSMKKPHYPTNPTSP